LITLIVTIFGIILGPSIIEKTEMTFDIYRTETAQFAVITLQTSITQDKPSTLLKGICIKNNGQYQFPCWFTPTEREFNSFTSIAKEVYGNYEMAGRIAELFRNEEGLIMAVTTSRDIIVPDPKIEGSINYLTYYLNNDMKVGISECYEVNTQFPCILEVKENETFESIVEKYYPNKNDSMVKRLELANDIEYFYNEEKGWPDLRPISEITDGTLIILPKMP